MRLKANKLREFRLAQRLKMIEVSKMSGISYSALSLIENGWRNLSPKEAELLIQAYRKFSVDAELAIRPLIAA